MAQVDEDEYLDVLQKLAEEKYESLKSNQHIIRRKKTMDYLVAKGFESDLVRAIVTKL